MKYKNFIVKDNNIAVVGIVVFEKQVLFLKRKNPPLNWCPPCGRAEIGETLEDALKREIKEETNLICKKYKFVFFWDGYYLNTKPIKSFIYVCQSKNDKVILSPSEHSEYFWVDINDLDSWQNKTDFDISNWSKWIKDFLFC